MTTVWRCFADIPGLVVAVPCVVRARGGADAARMRAAGARGEPCGDLRRADCALHDARSAPGGRWAVDLGLRSARGERNPRWPRSACMEPKTGDGADLGGGDLRQPGFTSSSQAQKLLAEAGVSVRVMTCAGLRRWPRTRCWRRWTHPARCWVVDECREHGVAERGLAGTHGLARARKGFGRAGRDGQAASRWPALRRIPCQAVTWSWPRRMEMVRG